MLGEIAEKAFSCSALADELPLPASRRPQTHYYPLKTPY